MSGHSELQRLCDRKGVKIDCHYGGVEVPEGWTPGTHAYKVTLRYQRRRMTCAFFMGPGNTHEPTTADVIACLCLDASAGDQPFEEWARDMGYDPDSRKAEATYKACYVNAAKIKRLLGDDFETFARAEH